MNIKELIIAAHKNSVEKGFYESEFNTSEKLMLIVSEIAEAQEADRKGNHFNIDSFEEIHKTAIAEIPNKSLDEVFQITFKKTIKDSFADELADACIRIFDLCGSMDIDLEKHIELKMRFNSLRPHKHGKKY